MRSGGRVDSVYGKPHVHMMGRFFSGLAQSDCGDSGGSRSRESMSRDEGFALALKDTGMVYSWGRGTKVDWVTQLLRMCTLPNWWRLSLARTSRCLPAVTTIVQQ